MELEILVRKAKRGDKDAFLELMLSHKEYLYRTAYLYTRNQELACDAVQECIIKSMESIDKLKKPEFFKSWITYSLIPETLSIAPLESFGKIRNTYRSRNGTPRNGRRRKHFPGRKKWIYTRP